MAPNSRQKGAAFENEIARQIFEHLGVQVKRNLEQYREKNQGDLVGLEGWCIECKRYAEPKVQSTWWDQVCRSCTGNEIPALIIKFDRRETFVIVPWRALSKQFDDEGDSLEAAISFADWIYLVRESMQ